MLVKVDNNNLTTLFLCSLKTCCYSFLTHNSFAVTQLTTNCIFRILMTKRHGVSINSDCNIYKGMKNGSSGTDITGKFSLVSVHTDEQTLTKDFIFYIIGRSCHNSRCKVTKKFGKKGALRK